MKQLNKEKNMKMTICFTSKKIIINKGFAEKATVYGSEEYIELLKAVENFEKFEVVVK